MEFARQEYCSELSSSPPRDLPNPGIKPASLTSPVHWQAGSSPLVPPGKPYTKLAAKTLQSCPTLCDPIDGSPPGSSVHGILQARILEWVAISSFRGCFQPRDQIHVSCLGFFNTEPPGKPLRNSLMKYKNRQVYILLTLEAFM